MKYVVLVLLLLLAVPCTAAPAGNLPERGVVGADWVTNIPAEQYFGLTIYRVIPRKIGWFIEGKFGRSRSYEDSNYYENISIATAEGWGDRLLKEQTVYNTYGGGLTYALRRNFFLYSGVGISTTSSYRQYHDEFQILGDNGDYWIDGPDGDTNTNFVFGGMLRTSRSFVIQAGYDTNPSGLNLGIGLVGDWPFG